MVKASLWAALLAIATLATPSLAREREVPSNIAKGGIPITIAKGHGVVLSFIQSGETAYRASLSDPSRIVLSGDSGLCSALDGSCEGQGSQVLFLKAIDPVSIQGLPSSSDGSTTLTVLTTSAKGKKVYQFNLSVKAGTPDFTLISIVGD